MVFKSHRCEHISKFPSLEKKNSGLKGEFSEIGAKLQAKQQKVVMLENKHTSMAEKLRCVEGQIAKDSSFIGSFQSQMNGVDAQVEEAVL